MVSTYMYNYNNYGTSSYTLIIWHACIHMISVAVDVSLASSLLGIPFSTNPGALTIFQCSSATKLAKL